MSDLIPVKSSNIDAIGWESDGKVLTVQFSNGTIYTYFDVPEATYTDILSAQSVGSTFASTVKGKYPYRRIK